MRTFRSLARTPDPSGVRLLLDGAHLVRDAHSAGITLETVVIAKSQAVSGKEESALAEAIARSGVEVVEADDQVFGALSPVRTPSGIAAIGRRLTSNADEICKRVDAFVLAIVSVQDPGNVGSLVRVAEAAGATGALVCGTSANPFSWKSLRGSMGSALRMPIAFGLTPRVALSSMKASGIRTIAAIPRTGRSPDEVDWYGRIGLILGGEGSGLPDQVVAGCDDRVSIEMASPVESLNVAAAGAVLLYAARRQRTRTMHNA